MDDLLNIGAAYIRVSDERQDEFSPDSQLKRIREYAAKEGYLIPEEYIFYDDGISGRSVKKRDEFKRMITTAIDKSHPFDKIYVWKYSRFARCQEEAITYKSLLSKHKVAVVSVSEALPDGAFGSLIERIIEWEDEFYSSRLSEEVNRGMLEKVSRGLPVVPPPFGYGMVNGEYVPNEEKAEIVREVFESFADGAKVREIAVSLGQRGVRTKYGNMPDNRWIEYMLRNSCYIGKIRYSTDGSRSFSKRRSDNENITVVDGKHEPIIPLDLWNDVQKKLDEQKRMYPKYSRRDQPIEYMLKGLVRCSSCGGTLAVSSVTSGKNKILTLQCCNYARGVCHTSHSITLNKVESAFIEGLKSAVGNQQFTITRKPRKTEAKPVDFDKLIVVEERRLERAKQAYLAEIDSIEQYAKNKKEITERIDDLKRKRDDECTQEVDLEAFSSKVFGVVEYIESPEISPQKKNEALRSIIEKVVYNKAEQGLAIYFHDI